MPSCSPASCVRVVMVACVDHMWTIQHCFDLNEDTQNKTAKAGLQGPFSPRLDQALQAAAVPVAGFRISTTDMQAPPRRSKTGADVLPNLR
jgi:hypothetical protein